MNKKAEDGEILRGNVIYLILLLVFSIIMLLFVASYSNGAAIWSEFYAKETTRLINSGGTGDTITIDVQRATEIAQSNDITSRSEIFEFNNGENEVCVKLSRAKKTCYNYFNDVTVIEPEINLGLGDDEPNTLSFKLVENVAQPI